MLTGKNILEVAAKLHNLQAYGAKLTGSWFFGSNNNASDIDLFLEPFPHEDEALYELGFRKLTSVENSYLLDSNTIRVWRNRELGIDVQIVKSARLKELAQSMLKDLHITQPSISQWEIAFQTCKNIYPYLRG